ncbi:MAG: family 43 glycosylhydrolase [Bacteroidales bacterium]|nr:family 43 glycosylhydrolase [Bacteroidales bacterium]
MTGKTKIWFVLASLVCSFALTGQSTFTNPVGGEQPDPYVVYKDGYYYFCATEHNGVKIRKSEKLHEVAKASAVVVWEPDGNTQFGPVWAPELHYIQGKWYIYTTAKPCGGDCQLNSVVLEGTTQNPQDPFIYKGILAGGIDGTVLQTDNDSLYFVWMRDEGGTTYDISIAPMVSPVELGLPKVRISREPFFGWETRDQHCNEGPAILKRGNKIHIVYSASASWTRWYCLGRFTNSDGNLLSALSWEKSPDPIFQQSEYNGVYSTGHCSFTTSPDGSEDWIMYHAKGTTANGWDGRMPHLQKFYWDENDNPEFGIPHPQGAKIPVPSDGSCQQQTLTFDSVPDNIISAGPIELLASASSGLPVEFAVLKGPATLTGNSTNLTGLPGTVSVTAFQAGNETFCPSLETLRKFKITDPAPNYSNGTGLKGAYYNGSNFETFILERTDPQVNFNWGNSSPISSINSDNFSVRWKGYIEPLYSGINYFTIVSDNGRKLWVDNKILINKWINDWDVEYTGAVMLEAGKKYPIQIDYFEVDGGANIKLYWAMETQDKSIVPQSQLFPSNEASTDNAGENGILIFPNPGNGRLTIDSPGSVVNEVRIVDINGREVFFMSQPFTGQKNMSLQHLKAGIYFCHLKLDNKTVVHKLNITG